MNSLVKPIAIYHYVVAVLLLGFALLNYEVLKPFFNDNYLEFTESSFAEVGYIIFYIGAVLGINYWAVMAEFFALLQSTLVVTLVLIGLAILYFLTGRGLLHEKIWARNSTRVLSGILVLVILLVTARSIIGGSWQAILGTIGLIFQGFIFGYSIFSKSFSKSHAG